MRIRIHIQKKTEKYIRHNNKGKMELFFNQLDWIWVHLRKDRSPAQRKSKLSLQGDGPF